MPNLDGLRLDRPSRLRCSALERWATGWQPALLRAGIPTIIWNRTMEATRDLAELGAEVAGTAAGAALRAAIVLTMVTDADAVMSVARDQGMLAALAPGAIWAQMSTIGVAGTDRVAAIGFSDRMPRPTMRWRRQCFLRRSGSR